MTWINRWEAMLKKVNICSYYKLKMLKEPVNMIQ